MVNFLVNIICIGQSLFKCTLAFRGMLLRGPLHSRDVSEDLGNCELTVKMKSILIKMWMISEVFIICQLKLQLV